MNDVKEVLWRLVGEVQDCGCDVTDVVEMNYVENDVLVDHLIANGVEIKKHGHWEDEYGGKYANPRYRCSRCKAKALYAFEKNGLDQWFEVQALTTRCHSCGAHMDEELRTCYCPLCDKHFVIHSNESGGNCPDCGHHVALHKEDE